MGHNGAGNQRNQKDVWKLAQLVKWFLLVLFMEHAPL